MTNQWQCDHGRWLGANAGQQTKSGALSDPVPLDTVVQYLWKQLLHLSLYRVSNSTQNDLVHY